MFGPLFLVRDWDDGVSGLFRRYDLVALEIWPRARGVFYSTFLSRIGQICGIGHYESSLDGVSGLLGDSR